MSFPSIRTLWRRGITALLAGLVLALLAACSKPTPTGLIFNPAPWQDGEQHTFRLTDVDGNRAGTATFTMTGGTNDTGEAMWSIERVISAQGDTETLTMKVGAAGFRPQSSYL